MKDYKKSLEQSKKDQDFLVDDEIIEELVLEIQPRKIGDDDAKI
jgi:hypothetical protein